MDHNGAALGAVQEYLHIDKPGYALLVDAPWGAGKTHFIIAAAGIGSDENVRYVSLNGVDDPASFRRALLSGLLTTETVNKSEKLGNLIGKLTKAGDLGSMLRDVVEDNLLSSLPATLVFDDVERCTIEPSVLFGLLNSFVEHQGKRVVIIAHSGRVNDKVGFFTRKEKLVGRTVTIEADCEAALPIFIGAMKTGKGKTWFLEHQALVLEVFRDCEHNNLRVLRQTLFDFGRIIDVLCDDLLTAEDAMQRLARTYLALAMPVAINEITAKDLAKRDSHKLRTAPKGEETPHPLHALFKKHRHAEIYAGSNASILPIDLGVALIGTGYETPERINTVLRSTGQFDDQDANPLWKRMVYWLYASSKELEALVKEANAYLFEAEKVEAGPYLHIAGGLLRIAEFKGLETGASDMAEKIKKRIGELKDQNAIPMASHGRGFGWEKRGHDFVFGGYCTGLSKDFAAVTEAMRSAQIALFDESLPGEGQRLLQLFDRDLDGFVAEFTYSNGNGSYQNVPCLDHLDTAEFAESVVGKIQEGQASRVYDAIEALASRHNAGEIWDAERCWAADVKNQVLSLATNAGPLAQAQIQGFLQFRWKFTDPVASDPEGPDS